MGRLIWFSQILCLSFMLFQFRVQSPSPSQSSPDSPPHVCHPEERSVLLDFKSTTALGVYLGAPHQKMETWKRSIDCCLWEGITYDKMEGHLIGLDLSWNWIEANLTANGSLSCLEKLQRLNLVYNKFSYLNLSFGFHRWESLTSLNLSASEYVDGSLLFEIFLLPKLVSLDFSNNYGLLLLDNIMFRMIVHTLTELRFLILDSVNMSLVVPSSLQNLTSSLEYLSLSAYSLQGNFPSQVFQLPSLRLIDLSHNHYLRGSLLESNWSSTLKYLYLKSTSFSRELSHSIRNFSITDLSSTNLSGTITPNMLSRLEDLNDLDLSNNSLLSLSNNGTVVNYSFLKLLSLRFSSCNMHKFPSFLRKAESLLMLDISKNKISGQIHKWRIEGMPLDYLNLSSNFLTGIYLLALGYLLIVELRSNLLQGSLPILSTTWYFMYLIISGNNIAGEIPSSYCNLTSLRVLVLANNSLGGKIPECLGNLSDLSILDLGMNKFHGRIPNSFVKNSSLRTLKLNGNQLEGRLPSSLVHCRQLEVLDVGNNRLNDSFPQWLGVLPSLQVLILRLNLFHGAISNSMPASHFPQLKIIDVSHNDFTGPLPSKYFKNLRAMRDATGAHKAKLEYIGDTNIYYMDSVTVTMKGLEVTLVRIFKTFTTIDFSSNRFLGQIPEELGELNSLVLLNLSHNSLNGEIPSSWGGMAELESLDLSSNKLSGRIPEQLTNLTFLSVLKLSHNELEGVIPLGKQFNTFSNDSYIGNHGLCGFPLTKKCHPEEPGAPPSKFDKEDDSATLFNWRFALAGYGCGLVLGLSQGYIAFTTGKPWWVVKKVEKYERKFVGRSNGRHKKRKTQKPNQRF
ncbi:hypothetical protein SLE2022_353950 [Rubroshorea leprosula]